jgi:hypothetical protein
VPGTGGAPQLLDLPFVGAARAIRSWDTPSDLALNLCIVAVAMLFTVLAARSDLLLAWGALPFVVLAVVLAEGTWAEPFDLSRALTPIFTAAPFLLAIRRRDTVGPMADAPAVGR